MLEPRQYTVDEVRKQVLEYVWGLVDHWLNESRTADTRGKLSGLAFSFMVMLDGGSVLPGFVVAPSPHPDDEDYHRENGDNWFPRAESSPFDITPLHEVFYKYDPKPPREITPVEAEYIHATEQALAFLETMLRPKAKTPMLISTTQQQRCVQMLRVCATIVGKHQDPDVIPENSRTMRMLTTEGGIDHAVHEWVKELSV
jgi:hypothetical protein